GFFAIPGEDIFTNPTTDCARNGDASETITRTVDYIWSEISIGADYQIRAFYDQLGDFHPLFSVRAPQSFGDVAGAAFDGITDGPVPIPAYKRISFAEGSESTDGQVITGVLVSLVSPVNTEIPLSRLSADSLPLSSAATVPLDADPIVQDELQWQLTRTSLELVPEDDPVYAAAFEAAGIEFNFNSENYAFFIRAVDIIGGPDGEVDLHPLLSTPSAPFPWFTPIIQLTRARTPFERSVGIPSVSLLASVRAITALGGQQTVAPEIQFLVPPIALVNLNPASPLCQVPYIPPRNIAPLYESLPSECQELPTGQYSISVLQGIAGGEVADAPVPISTTGTNINGGQFITQAWQIPNLLGPPDVGIDSTPRDELPPELQIPEQGPDGRFLIFDADPTAIRETDACLASIDPAVSLTQPRLIDFIPIPEVCCEGVQSLCGLPLCEAEEASSGFVRTAATNVNGAPGCVPFEMPPQCCSE
ncbi:MAG: hypothetical protein AAF658_18005, partial [Myxococcota bacterium]